MAHMTRKVKTPDGRASRWDDHREQRRTQLVDAAIIAIDRLGHQAGIADIAAEAGVSKAVLYRYFADKSVLHAAVGARMAEETMAQEIGSASYRASGCKSV